MSKPIRQFYGFDGTKRDASELRPGSMADGSKNVLIKDDTILTPPGFAKVSSGSLPLDSGNPVLAQHIYIEMDGTSHWLVATVGTIQERDYRADTWNDLTQSGVSFNANPFDPISFTNVGHTDAVKLNGSGNSWYHHCLANNGGAGPVQRWGGKFETDFADLIGADGYHDTASGRTTHYCLQVGLFKSHVLLINPKEANAANNLVNNNQRVRWAPAGKIETWSGTGSGYSDLIDTGGHNVWSALLRDNYIIYQNNSIWAMNYRGGGSPFDPRPEIPNLGLLSPHLFCSKNNVHYFVGDDYNLYAYHGGAEKEIIGDNLHRFLRRDIVREYAMRSWLCMGKDNERLWLYIVPTGQLYATEAYAIDRRTGTWMRRDFTHKWTDSASGISSIFLVGSVSFDSGKSYRQLLLDRSPSKTVAIGGCVRSSNVVTVTTGTAHAMVVGETAVLANVDSGDEATAFSGSHTIASVPASPKDANDNPTTFTFAQTADNESNLAAGTAIVDKAPTSVDYQNSGETSREMLEPVFTNEEIAIGSSDGYIYQFDPDVTTDDGVTIPTAHITEVIDAGKPGWEKIWPAIRIMAKGTTITVSYRIASFETTGTGWVNFSAQALTSEFVEYFMPINETSKKIQFKFSGGPFVVSGYELDDPVFLSGY